MKKCLVTGGSTGIGRSVVKKLSLLGVSVVNLDINEPIDILDNETFIKCDLSNYKSISKIFPVEDTFDAVFLNVGIHSSGDIFTQEFDDIQTVINTNLMSHIAIIKLLEKNIENVSSIVFNGSDQCFIGKHNSFAYGLTKGAIGQITKSLALDFTKYNVRVNAVCPGTIDTPLYRDAIEKYANETGINILNIEKEEAAVMPIGRVAQADEVANVVIFLLSSASSFMTGALVPVDGGYTAQ